ncbi:FHA domain-containing protein [Pelotomaculum propionicicum]|uniref:FHA domain-containing protein n=1 Tax=Pelotomaculum propionicicum TaxID=258475 RepID=UPI003B7A84DE
MACLVVTLGPDQGQKAGLETGTIYIGRDASSCSLVLSDPKVSRVHAVVRLLPGGTAVVEDGFGGSYQYGQGIERGPAVIDSSDYTVRRHNTHERG